MQIEYALIADHAEIVGAKLYLMGGGWDTMNAPRFPAQLRIAVALGVRIGWSETNTPVPVHFTIEDDDGAELARLTGSLNVGRPAHLPPGSTQLAQMAVSMILTLQKAGGYRVAIRAGGEDGLETRDLTLPFRVLAPPAGPAPA